MCAEDELLPSDMQIEIMKRLPVNSLMKFRSVSKTWKSIIHSSRFIADYKRNTNQSFVGYQWRHDIHIFDDDNNFLKRLTPPMSDIIDLIGYSRGLFAFRNYNKEVIIWNPSIRKSVVIPAPPKSKGLNQLLDFSFTVCNSSDPTILRTSCMPRLQVEIYRLSTGDWRTLSIPPLRESLRLEHKIVIDRFIHWIAYDTTPEGIHLNNLILSFDITGEQFIESCLPPTLAAQTFCFNLELSKFKESLVVLQTVRCEIVVWMMMMGPGVQNSFTKLFTVKLRHMVRPLRRRELGLGFMKDGQPIIYFKVIRTYQHELVVYEPDSEHFNRIWSSGSELLSLGGDERLSHAGSYMETLLLLDR